MFQITYILLNEDRIRHLEMEEKNGSEGSASQVIAKFLMVASLFGERNSQDLEHVINSWKAAFFIYLQGQSAHLP